MKGQARQIVGDAEVVEGQREILPTGRVPVLSRTSHLDSYLLDILISSPPHSLLDPH